jgi:hypothetical protein
VDSKQELEARLNTPIEHFAFPFGSKLEADKREYKISAEAGFRTITTTVHGHIHRNHNLKQLNRVFLLPLYNNHTTLGRVLYWNLKSSAAFIRSSFHFNLAR